MTGTSDFFRSCGQREMCVVWLKRSQFNPCFWPQSEILFPMYRTFLKHIRVNSIKELKDRILLGIQEINAAPVIHRWKKFDAVAKY